MNLDKRLLNQVVAVRVNLALAVGMGLLAGIVLVGQAHYLSQVVNRVFLEGKTGRDVRPLLLTFLVLSLARAALSWGSDVNATRVAGRVKTDLRARLSAHLLALGPAYARGERSGELTNTVVEGIETLDAYFSQYLPQLALASLVPLMILAFVLPLDFLSGLVLFLTAPLIPVFMILIGSLADALTKRQWASLSRMSAHFLDVMQGLTTLKLFGRSRDQVRAIADVSDRFRQTTLGVLRVAFLSSLTLEMVATLCTAVVAVEIGLRLLYGRLAFEQAFFVLILAPEFYLPLRLLGTRFHAGISGVAAAQRIFDVLEKEPPSSPLGESREIEDPLPPLSFHVRFSDVFYTYSENRESDGRPPALNGFSFEIMPGQKVALVGPSGAGKSTVANLLLRFVEPDQGLVTVDGVPLGDLPASDWRAQVAWVSQNPYLFHTTVADNIRLARPDAKLDEVMWAARQAHAHHFIQALPHGYDTLVGERGTRLSGGQAQRIALARAFLKDAPLLILDEATANLDPEYENLLWEAMERLTQGRTSLIIAHRLSTTYRADRIVVMARGRVVEAGTHAALLRQDGLYRRLVTAYSAPSGLASTSTGELQDLPPLPESQVLSYASEDPSPLPSRAGVEGKGERDSLISTFWRLLKLAAPFWTRMVLATLLGFATIGSSIGLMSTAAFIIAKAALRPSIAELQVAIVGVRFFGIARGVFRYLERYISHQVTFRLLSRLRVWFYQSLEPLAPARLMQYRSGDLLSRVVADIDNLEHLYVRVIAPPAVALLVGLLMWFLMRSYSLWLAVISLIFLGIGGVVLPLLARWLSRGLGRQVVKTRSDLNVAMVDGIQGMADLLAFGQEGDHQQRVGKLSQELVGLQVYMAQGAGLQGALTGLLANLATWAVLVIAIPLVVEAKMDGVYLGLLALAVMASFEAVSPLPLAFQYLEKSLEAGQRLFEIVDAQPVVYDPPSPSAISSKYGLSVKDLSFRYGPGEPLVLDNVSFVLPQGGQVAIVGPSGAGKSTLVNVLLRFWDYETGQVLLGDQDLRGYRQEDLCRVTSVVSQHTHLFNATVRENLLIACSDASEADIVQATSQAQIHEFIQSLPQGYDTWIGEQGLRLSGGQRQRLAIARALLKDAPILILDEATANLDSLTERDVVQAIQTMMTGRSTLIITHRLVGLETVGEILVLHKGQIVERGRHQDLWQMRGLYHRMWELQNQKLALDLVATAD